jgi:hypothetical protein
MAVVFADLPISYESYVLCLARHAWATGTPT